MIYFCYGANIKTFLLTTKLFLLKNKIKIIAILFGGLKKNAYLCYVDD
jgi:hypothetical protein